MRLNGLALYTKVPLPILYFIIFQDLNNYSEIIKNCIDCTKHQLVILIDSIDEASNLENLDWLPTKLIDNVKFILTVTSSATSIDQCNEDDLILHHLKDKISKSNFLYLNPFSSEQWKDVLSSGGGDFYATCGALQLPEAWLSSSEKIPLQAKVHFQKYYYIPLHSLTHSIPLLIKPHQY